MVFPSSTISRDAGEPRITVDWQLKCWLKKRDSEKRRVLSTQLGPRQTKDGVVFSYYDPLAKDVQLAGDFSDWKPMGQLMVHKKNKHIWTGTVLSNQAPTSINSLWMENGRLIPAIQTWLPPLWAHGIQR